MFINDLTHVLLYLIRYTIDVYLFEHNTNIFIFQIITILVIRYFVHRVTGETRWDTPACLTSELLRPRKPWIRKVNFILLSMKSYVYFSHSNPVLCDPQVDPATTLVYFRNIQTKLKTWQRPIPRGYGTY